MVQQKGSRHRESKCGKMLTLAEHKERGNVRGLLFLQLFHRVETFLDKREHEDIRVALLLPQFTDGKTEAQRR